MQKSSETANLTPQDWFARAAQDRRRRPDATPVDGQTRIFDITDLIDLLYRGRRVIAISVAATTLLALAYGVTSSKRYEAETQVFIDSRGYRVLSNEVLQLGGGYQALAPEFATELRIMQSGAVLRRVVEQENLTANPAFMHRPGYRQRLMALLFGPPPGTPDRTAVAMGILARMIDVRRSDQSFIANVAVTSGDPELAARLARAVAQAYLSVQALNRQELTRRLASEIGGRLQDLREQVETAEERLAAYRKANNLVVSAGTLMSDQDLTELNRQLNEARARTARVRSQLEQARAASAGARAADLTQTMLNSPTIVQLQIRLADATRRLAELRRSLGPRHPDIGATEAVVGETRSALAAEIRRQRLAISKEFDEALANEKALEARIGELKSDSGNVSRALIGARELERAVEANRKVYEEFLVRARELSEQQGIAPSASRIITEASVPTQPINTSLLRLLLAGMLAGLPLGVGLAFLRDAVHAPRSGQLSRTGDDDADAPWPDAADAPPGVPAYAPADTPPDLADPVSEAHEAVHYTARLPAEALGRYVELSRLRRVVAPPDALHEAALAIHEGIGDGEPNLTLVAGYGDQSEACDFATAFASWLSYQGYDVLLVDADPRQARLADRLGLLGAPGLFDRFHRRVEDILAEHRPGIPSFLGSLTPHKRRMPEGLSRLLAQRLAELGDKADYVILYAGNIVENPCATVLLEACNQAIVAGPDRETTAGEAAGAGAALEDAGLAIVASVRIVPAGSQNSTPPRRTRASSARGGGDRVGMDPVVMGAGADGKDDDNKKHRRFGRKGIVG